MYIGYVNALNYDTDEGRQEKQPTFRGIAIAVEERGLLAEDIGAYVI